MPSNNLTSLLSLANASSRIRGSQHPQITTTGNRVSRASSQTPSTPSSRHRRASSLDSSPISAVPSAPKRQRVGDSQVTVSQERLERLERNQKLILKELAILKGLFASQSPSALTGLQPSDAAVGCKVGGMPNARHPDRYDFRKEVTRKLTVWRNERKQVLIKSIDEQVFDLPSRLSFVPKGCELLEGGRKRNFRAWLTRGKREVLEFVLREDEARFGAANRTSVGSPVQKEFMEWQAMNRSRMVPVWRKGKEGRNEGYGREDGKEIGQSRNVDSSARTGEEDEEDSEEDGE
ncbi:hypothetical protein C360_04741 [Cryptococcus neoformans Bt15]|nr:hypothetical protein C360_04741 [Cryptococcus neoformans var. grubii Bt15]